MIDKAVLDALRASLPETTTSGQRTAGSGPKTAPASAPSTLHPARSLAFFDLDGTMARGHMIFDFPAHLLAAGLFTPATHARIVRMQDGFRKKRLSYRDVAEELPRLYALGIKGQKTLTIQLEAEKFVENRMGKVHSYARPLVMLMREFGRPGLALSGSPVETVNALSRRLGMEAALGTVLETRAGLFTGKVLRNLILKETKRACFRELIKKLQLDARACFGFGDTEQDESFLSGVGHPVALNPVPNLRAMALKKGWDVFVDTQDVVLEVRKLAVIADAVQG